MDDPMDASAGSGDHHQITEHGFHVVPCSPSAEPSPSECSIHDVPGSPTSEPAPSECIIHVRCSPTTKAEPSPGTLEHEAEQASLLVAEPMMVGAFMDETMDASAGSGDHPEDTCTPTFGPCSPPWTSEDCHSSTRPICNPPCFKVWVPNEKDPT